MISYARRMTSRVLIVQLLTVALLVLPAAPALAVECRNTGGNGNWAVGAGGGGDRHSAGVRGSSKVFNPDLTYRGMHVESLYVWNDYSNMIEFGWVKEARPLRPDFRGLFDARMYDGDYTTRDIQDLAYGSYEFWMARQDNGWYKFRLNSNWYNSPYVRTPPWRYGAPFAVGEIANQCDNGVSKWWGLDRKLRNDTWDPWQRLHKNCDTMTAYGFDKLSDRSFAVRRVSNRYTSRCDVLG